jgi:hypothetical protein
MYVITLILTWVIELRLGLAGDKAFLFDRLAARMIGFPVFGCGEEVFVPDARGREGGSLR